MVAGPLGRAGAVRLTTAVLHVVAPAGVTLQLAGTKPRTLMVAAAPDVRESTGAAPMAKARTIMDALIKAPFRLRPSLEA
jgi:hypothetical protein